MVMSDDPVDWRMSVLVPAAGDSTRMGGPVRKPWMQLAGQPILLHTLRAIRAWPGVDEVIVLVHPEDLENARGPAGRVLMEAGATLVAAGGASRNESVWAGLEILDPSTDLVAVHDAVRPFLGSETAGLLARTAWERGAAVPMLPTVDTVKRIEVDQVTETVRRHGLVRIQTPQVFRLDLLLDAHEAVRATGGYQRHHTDDASLVEAAGEPVSVVMGEPWNLKITTREDLRLAEALIGAGLVTVPGDG